MAPEVPFLVQHPDELFLLKSMFYITDVKSFQVADGSINIVAYWG